MSYPGGFVSITRDASSGSIGLTCKPMLDSRKSGMAPVKSKRPTIRGVTKVTIPVVASTNTWVAEVAVECAEKHPIQSGWTLSSILDSTCDRP